jgi:hypothetical protein
LSLSFVVNLVELSVAGLKPRQTLLFMVVSECMSLVVRMESRTQESQRERNGLPWFGPIGVLRLGADDPYIQEHPKSGGLQQSVRVKERFGRASLGADPRDASPSVVPSPSPERRKMMGTVEELSMPLSWLLCSRCRARMER